MPDNLVCPKCSAEVAYRDAVGRELACPHCGTPLTPEHAAPAGTAPAIPQEVQAMLEKALQLAQASGHVGPLPPLQAIRFYRQASGASFADAKRAIDSAGQLHVAGLASGMRPAPSLPASGAKGGCWIGILVMVSVVCVLIGGLIARWPSHGLGSANQPNVPSAVRVPSISQPPAPPAPPQFATLELEFGSKGTGPAHFDDARSIALDNQGHLYVGEYSNGRVQVFDTNGKYLSEFSVAPGNALQNLIADRNGTVYAVSSSHILRFTGATGAPLPEMDNGADTDSPKRYTDACLAPGGVMYAISYRPGAEEIVKLDTASGKITSAIDIKKSVGESHDFSRIVATTTGEVYLLDRQKGVFQFAVDGRYINRFGGGKTAGVSPTDMPASQLFSPFNLAVDGQGHLYVSDAGFCIKVYDKEGNYLDKFGGNQVAFGIAIDDQDTIFACLRNRHTVGKYAMARH